MYNNSGANLEAIDLARRGKTKDAIKLFEAGSAYSRDAYSMSWYAICLAREGGKQDRARALAKAAVIKEFCNAELYLNLGRVCLMAEDKGAAVENFEQGLTLEPHNGTLMAEMRLLGMRRTPPIPFLARSNPLNRYLGRLSNN